MRTLFKILVIVTAAVMVAGLLYGVVTLTSSNTNSSQMLQDRQMQNGNDIDFGSHDEGGIGMQFPVDSLKNLTIIAFIGTVYISTIRLWNRKKNATLLGP